MKPVYALIAAAALLPVTALHAAITTTGDVQSSIPPGSTSYSLTSGGLVVGYNNAGTLTVDSGSSLSVTTQGQVGGGAVNYVNGAGGVGDVSITGAGSTFTYSYGTFQLGVSVGSSMEVTNGASATFGNLGVGYGAKETSSLTITGANLSLPTGTLYDGYSGTGNVTINGGSKVLLGRNVPMGQLAGSSGTLTITGAGTEVDMTSTFTGSSGIRVGYNGSSTLNIGDGALLKFTGVNNIVMGCAAGVSGTVNLSGGTVNLGGNAIYVGNGTGTFNFTGGSLISVGAVGTATVSMPLVQQGGLFSAGTANSTVGTATIYGTYTLGTAGTLGIDLADANGIVGTSSDYYAVTGNATLGGALAITTAAGFTPIAGETFNVLTAPSINTAGLVSNGMYRYSVIAGGSGQILQLTTRLLGDANDDNKVDLSDLNIVLNNLGTTTSNWSAGNFDGAPTIDLTDLNDVLNNLGTSLPSAASVVATPEPAGLALLAVGALLLKTRKNRRI